MPLRMPCCGTVSFDYCIMVLLDIKTNEAVMGSELLSPQLLLIFWMIFCLGDTR